MVKLAQLAVGVGLLAGLGYAAYVLTKGDGGNGTQGCEACTAPTCSSNGYKVVCENYQCVTTSTPCDARVPSIPGRWWSGPNESELTLKGPTNAPEVMYPHTGSNFCDLMNRPRSDWQFRRYEVLDQYQEAMLSGNLVKITWNSIDSKKVLGFYIDEQSTIVCDTYYTTLDYQSCFDFNLILHHNPYSVVTIGSPEVHYFTASVYYGSSIASGVALEITGYAFIASNPAFSTGSDSCEYHEQTKVNC